MNSLDLLKASISDFAFKEHVVGGQCTCIFSLFFIFFRKILEIQLCIDMNCDAVPSYKPDGRAEDLSDE